MLSCPTNDIVALQISQRATSPSNKDHVCHYQKCTIKSLDVEIHKMCDKYYIVCKFIKPVKGLHRKRTLHKKLFDMYYCQESRKIHWCHAQCCGEKILSSESIETCTITGQQFQCEQVRNYGVAARVQTSVAPNKGDPLEHLRDSDGKIHRTSSVYNTKEEQCKKWAREVLHDLLFSDKRKLNELHKEAEVKKSAMKAVNKYKRVMEKKNGVKNILLMKRIYLNYVKERPNKLEYLLKTQRDQDHLIASYTKQLIGYWRMVLLKTHLGSTSPTQFQFKSFVPACLYLMKENIVMKNIVIIKKCQFLTTCLPEANTLNQYKIDKKAMTTHKNSILKAIKETVLNSKSKAQELVSYAQLEAEKVSI